MGKSTRTRASDRAPIQAALDAAMQAVPRDIASELFRKKLETAGIRDADALIKALTEHLFARTDDDFVWDDDTIPEDVLQEVMDITEDDIANVEAQFSRFLSDELPEIVRSTIDESGRSLARTLRRSWPDQYARELHDLTGFRMRLEQRWGKALHALRRLITVCRELGEEAHQRRRRSRSKKNVYRNDVLIRLHARACQVTQEILSLMEAGFADGAMARWRTLHEIAVVATLVADHGDDLAERYLAHEFVQSKKALDTYRAVYAELGYAPPDEVEAKRTEDACAYYVARYGPDFTSDHGWAGHHLGIKRPTFRDLENAAERMSMRAHYRMASDQVHAGVKGVTFRLSTFGRDPLILAGPSNFGFDEPGQSAGIDLARITTHIMDLSTVDETIKLKAVAILRDEVVNEFVQAGRKLKREESKERQKSKAPRRRLPPKTRTD